MRKVYITAETVKGPKNLILSMDEGTSLTDTMVREIFCGRWSWVLAKALATLEMVEYVDFLGDILSWEITDSK